MVTTYTRTCTRTLHTHMHVHVGMHGCMHIRMCVCISGSDPWTRSRTARSRSSALAVAAPLSARSARGPLPRLFSSIAQTVAHLLICVLLSCISTFHITLYFFFVSAGNKERAPQRASAKRCPVRSRKCAISPMGVPMDRMLVSLSALSFEPTDRQT